MSITQDFGREQRQKTQFLSVESCFSPSDTQVMQADEIRRLFGAKVRALRRAHGLTQEQLAEAVERSVDTISNIETGRLSTRIETAAKLATVFSVGLPELFDGHKEQRPAGDTRHEAAVARLVRLVEPLDVPTISALTDIAERILALR